MQRCSLLLILLLAGCGNHDLTRDFSLSRDTGPENASAPQMPLSMPPELATQHVRPNTFPSANNGAPPSPDQATGSEGQDALVQAAGPAASPDIRAEINQNAGLVYPDRGFIDRLMSWTPPAGYTPIISQPSGGGWLSRMF